MDEHRDRRPERDQEDPDSQETATEDPSIDDAEDASAASVTGGPLEESDEDPNVDADFDADEYDDLPDDDDDEDDELPDDDEVVEKVAEVGAADVVSDAAAEASGEEAEVESPPVPASDEDGDDDAEPEESQPATQADRGPKEIVGVLLMAYGGPDKLEDVPDYLLDVRSGRPMDQELVDEFVERYREIGGRSPILQLTQAQAAGVEKALSNRKSREAGVEYKTYVGMRHWHPYIRDVVPQILADGVDKLVAVVMAPHYSKMSVGKYMEQLHEALEKHEADIPVYEVHSWKDQPMFISGVSSRIRDALRKFPANLRKDVPIIYTAHSLPTRILEWGDPYPDELRVSVEMVADRVRQRHWRFAYQSQGATAEPWLGPDVESTLDELAEEGFKHVLMVPLGFVCDHVEILYDVDIEHKQHAEKLGIELQRIRSLNDGPMLCRAVAEAARKAMDPTAVSEEAELEEAGVADED